MKQKRYHIIIDVSKGDEQRLNDKNELATFLKELPGVIGMHVLKGPVIAQGIPQNPGLSGFVIIDFSHISIHTFTAFGEALVDIFSCKPFDQQKAIKKTTSYFKVKVSSCRIKEVYWG